MPLETFDPATNDLILQRPLEYQTRDPVVDDFGELGNQLSIAVAEKRVRRFALTFRAVGHPAYSYFEGFYNAHQASALRFNYVLPELIADPYKAPTVEAVTSGSQGSRTITVRHTWKNTVGETLASPTATIGVSANDLVKVTLPIYPPGATQAIIYAAEDDAGNEQSQVTLSDNLRTWTQPDAALLIGNPVVPTANTATETVKVFFVTNSFRIRRDSGQFRIYSVTIEEVY